MKSRWLTVRSRWSNSRVVALIPAFVFITLSGFRLTLEIMQPFNVGIDAKIYAAAAHAWLTGSDPWQASVSGVYFAAPPTSLIPFAPFAFLPGEVTVWFWIIGTLVMAILAIRSLGLPAWWIAFPPIVEGVVVGSLDIAVLAVLVLGRGRLASVAPLIKIYAVLPLLAERRFRDIALAGVLVVVTFPFLPWGYFFAGLPEILATLREQGLHNSIVTSPFLILVAIVALAGLGLRRALWLATPILSPTVQHHYMAISVPMLTPLIAVFWAVREPTIWLLGIVIAAVLARRNRLPSPSL